MRIHRFARQLSLFLLPLFAACESPSGGGGEDQGPSLDWLRANAVPFGTTAPGGSAADLAPLGQMIGDARIVGLGEGTHGSREFFEMKHRVTEYLVRARGFRVFAIEATWAEANRINRYVHTGEGDPAVLLSNLYFWTWNTQEVLDLILWMRAYNQTVPDDQEVSFYGFDLQYPRVAMADVEAYLDRADPVAADSARRYYSCYHQYEDRLAAAFPNYAQLSAEIRASCRAGVTAAYALVQRRADALVAASSRAEYETALRAARIVVQNEDLRANPAQGTAKRDQYMAENVEWLATVAHPQAKLVLWAHNAHVSRWGPFMGTHLAERYGAGYVPVGFSFHRGRFNAVQQGVGLVPHDAPAALDESYEHQFERLGHARFMVDLRPLRTGGAPAEAAWLLGPRPFRMIGAGYVPSQPGNVYGDHQLPAEYDIMIHLSQTTATRLLPFKYF